MQEDTTWDEALSESESEPGLTNFFVAYLGANDIAPQNPPDGTHRSDDDRSSVTSESLSANTEVQDTRSPPSDPGEPSENDQPESITEQNGCNHGKDDKEEEETCDSSSLNSWANTNSTPPLDEYEAVELDMFVNPGLPKLNRDQMIEHLHMVEEGIMPRRDEEDLVYRCIYCGWEVLDGECTKCYLAYEGLPQWEEEDEDEVTEWIPHSPLEVSAKWLSDKPPNVQDKVGDWLRKLIPRLENMHNSASHLYNASTVLTDQEISRRLESISREDAKIISKLREERWDNQTFGQIVKRERVEVAETVERLQKELDAERTKSHALKLEVDYLNGQKRDMSALQSELFKLQKAQKVVAWQESTSKCRKNHRAAMEEDVDLEELARKKAHHEKAKATNGGIGGRSPEL